MYEGYHKLNNQQAAKQLLKMVHVPDARLGVGDAEYLEPLNIEVYYPQSQRAVYIPKPSSIEDVTPDGYGSAFTEQDFPTLHYVGSAIGGI